jgi:hypothetical protein
MSKARGFLHALWSSLERDPDLAEFALLEDDFLPIFCLTSHRGGRGTSS